MQSFKQRRPKVLLVTGPTASGKSSLAFAIAQEFRGSIINADSMQVYRDLRILTSRPTQIEEAAVIHRLYGYLETDEVCSAGSWARQAAEEIEAAISNSCVPIIVGGTGLYLNALLHGLAPLPPIAVEVRLSAQKKLQELGNQAFHAALAERDPQTARRLSANDSQRLIRAWEVLEATDRSITVWHSDHQVHPPVAANWLKILLMPPRPELYLSCDERFKIMVESGAVDEVSALLEKNPAHHAPLMKAIGVKNIALYLKGKASLAEAIEEGRKETRRYAKRQVTWFQNQFSADIYKKTQYSESISDEIFSKIRQFLLT